MASSLKADLLICNTSPPKWCVTQEQTRSISKILEDVTMLSQTDDSCALQNMAHDVNASAVRTPNVI